MDSTNSHFTFTEEQTVDQPLPCNEVLAITSFVTVPGTLATPMSGVRCPTCAANGQEVWVIPGRALSQTTMFGTAELIYDNEPAGHRTPAKHGMMDRKFGPGIFYAERTGMINALKSIFR
ncbi:hypothetical protein BJ878DRAFT_478800 [Calycina marina]|uniref:Uncharacterized protein n=1 Tax=Calycina marina TaxID=1763456 RepID=A0A9P8CGP4_9HELO|nr:hypothetical protein BJ878DRAFT_478800 [Calycina marina]